MYDKNNLKKEYINYKENNIKGLEKLLRSPDYGLCDEGGIDWLITCCKDKLEKTSKADPFGGLGQFILTGILPFITLGISMIFKDSSSENLATILVSLVGILLLAFIGSALIKSIVLALLYPNQNTISQLQDDLQYIKMQREHTSKKRTYAKGIAAKTFRIKIKKLPEA